jgi:hypothetical protein
MTTSEEDAATKLRSPITKGQTGNPSSHGLEMIIKSLACKRKSRKKNQKRKAWANELKSYDESNSSISWLISLTS